MFQAWEHWIWIKPVTRQFVTDLELGTGEVLSQEIAGVQERIEFLHGANQQEYADAVEQAARTEYLDGFAHSAEPVFGHGYECFRVEIKGQRKVPPSGIGTGSADGSSYTYEPAQNRVD
jgi:hypothetical protein